MAIEEALLAENGVIDSGFGASKLSDESEECPRETLEEATASSRGQDCDDHSYVIVRSPFILLVGLYLQINH